MERKNRRIIRQNQHALIRLPSEGMKIVLLAPGQIVSLGKFGSFKVDEIFEYPFGQTFEILDEYKIRPIREMCERLDEDGDVEDDEDDEDHESFSITKNQLEKVFASGENNQNIIDIGSKIQKLSSDDISKLRESGVSSDVGQTIIDQIVAGHGGFDKKTIFSQQKYVKRKQQKFLRRFVVEYLGSSQLLQYYLDKDSQRVFEMTEENLGLLLSYANVRPGGKYLLIDETGGTILYAMMERMDGQGVVVCAHDNEHPNHIALRYSDFSEDHINQMVKSVNWLQFMEPETERIAWEDLGPEKIAELKLNKRNQYLRRQARAMEINNVLDLVTEGNFDALVAVSKLHMPTLLPHVLPKIGGSRPVVIYNQFKELLLETQHFLAADKRVLAPSIIETKVRPFQTIPGLFHPVMTMKGYGGYILWGTRVSPKDTGITAVGRGLSKRRREQKDIEDGEKDIKMDKQDDKKDDKDDQSDILQTLASQTPL